jgi:hypothetical protein
VIGALTQKVTGAKLVPVPFLLARTIGDGTGADVLRKDCPSARYVTCRFVPDLPLTENQFLWQDDKGTAWVMLPLQDRFAMAREQVPILLEVLKRYPVRQLEASTRNAVRQITDLDLTEFQRTKVLELEVPNTEFVGDMAEYRHSRIWAERLSFTPVSTYWLVLYTCAGAGAAVLLAARRMIRVDDRVRELATILLVCILLSAAVNGVLSGVAGRYASRISWLAMLSFIVILNQAFKPRPAAD